MRAASIPAIAVTLLVAHHVPAPACTNFLITRGATVDGSTIISYSADSHEFYGALAFKPGGRHAPGTKIDVYEWDTGKLLGQIDQAAVTYTVVGNMNEYQVSIGETTWGGREELKDPKGVVDYGSLMYLALARAKTAREAIEVMTGLVEKYGYHSTGESFSIADPQEVWILELIGKGPGNTGAVWVARLVPDGYVAAHANAPRIRQFPLDDAKRTLYAPDVITFARDKGWFAGKDEEFSFADTYSPDEFGARRFCDGRVWCMYRRAAPSLDLPSDWVRGVEDAEPLPLWIKPDRKLDVQDVIGYMRDHFEGTEFDMTADIGAGPFALPYRWRPMTWKLEGEEYLHERAVSTQQTGFSFVAQARSWLPNPIGGILWFGVDDTYSTVYFPMYCGAVGVPRSYAEGTGSFHDVDFDAAFWTFNYVSNFVYLRYADMIRDVQKVQQELEGRFRAAVPDVDSAALALHEQSPRLAKDYLTRFSQEAGDQVVARWRELGKFLLYKYMDGNVKTELGEVTHPDYPESWYRTVAAAAGDKLRVTKMAPERAKEAALAEKRQSVVDAIFTLLDKRGVAVDEASRSKILEAEELEQLEGWLVRAATAETVQQVTE
jgi:dipeptidase